MENAMLTQSLEVEAPIPPPPPHCSSFPLYLQHTSGIPTYRVLKLPSSSSCLAILSWHPCSFSCMDLLYSVPTSHVSISGLCHLCPELVSASEHNCIGGWGGGARALSLQISLARVLMVRLLLSNKREQMKSKAEL